MNQHQVTYISVRAPVRQKANGGKIHMIGRFSPEQLLRIFAMGLRITNVADMLRSPMAITETPDLLGPCPIPPMFHHLKSAGQWLASQLPSVSSKNLTSVVCLRESPKPGMVAAPRDPSKEVVERL